RSKRDWSSDVCSSDLEIVADKNDGTTINRLISPVSASQAGIVTPEMYNQWNAGGGGGGGLSFKNIGILRSTPVGATKTVDVGGRSEERRVGTEGRGAE